MNAHAGALERLGLGAGDIDRLGRYLDGIARWNGRVNLTAAGTPDARVGQLVAPVVGAVPLVRGPSLLDVGSGNGSPGLVLALLHPFTNVKLLEPRAKRWAFLREMARDLGLPQVEVQRVRHDQATAQATTVTVRAVALGAADLDPLVSPGGRVLVWRTQESTPAGWRPCGSWSAGTAWERST